VSLPGEPEDESILASSTAAKIGIPHERIVMAEFDADLLETHIGAFSEPFASYSALGMLQLSRAIKPFATVMLTGDGGDEAFLGYPVHLNSLAAQNLANRLPNFSPAIWGAIRRLVDPLSFLRRPKHFLDYATGGLGALTRVHDGLPYYRDNQLLGSRLRSGTVPQREMPASFNSARRLLSDLLTYNRHTEFVSEFLTKVDGATMYYAIEARSPFLDQGLWEFASSLDYSLRLRGKELKSIPRELVRRRVGSDVASRPKRGFQMPVERWLTSRWRSRLEELLDDCALTQEQWVQKEPLTRIVRAAIETGRGNIHLWRLMVLNMWFDRQASA
jgi:asparagine synthase (glutamine-hydrolysing)